MYSKNDYRYYLEHRLAESDDYLAHYGVKGMKWKHHIKNKLNKYLNFYKSNDTYDSGYKGGGSVKRIGVESKKNPNKYLEATKRKYKDGSRETDIYFSPTKKQHYKRIGRVRIESSSEGGIVRVDTSSKKRYKKNNAEELGSVVRGGNYATVGIAHDVARNAQKKRKKK